MHARRFAWTADAPPVASSEPLGPAEPMPVDVSPPGRQPVLPGAAAGGHLEAAVGDPLGQRTAAPSSHPPHRGPGGSVWPMNSRARARSPCRSR